MDHIRDKHNFAKLDASGLAVGLKEGLMGNSEVGWVQPVWSGAEADHRHLNIGAGRIVWQDIVRIDQCKSMQKHKMKLTTQRSRTMTSRTSPPSSTA